MKHWIDDQLESALNDRLRQPVRDRRHTGHTRPAKLLRPAIDRRLVNRHAALIHELVNVSVAQWVRGVPADADQDDVGRKAHSSEARHVK
jgi:hypothetical protein